jgi:hypothetical protein
MSTICRPTNNFTFQVETSQALLSHSARNEWVVDPGCTHHMAEDVSLFTYLVKVVERKIYVVYDFTLDIIGHSDVPCQHGRIFNVYHVLNLSANMLSNSQLTKIGNILEFFSRSILCSIFKESLFDCHRRVSHPKG